MKKITAEYNGHVWTVPANKYLRLFGLFKNLFQIFMTTIKHLNKCEMTYLQGCHLVIVNGKVIKSIPFHEKGWKPCPIFQVETNLVKK